MQFKVPKSLSYPFIIIAAVAIIVISIYSFLNSIGVRMNPPQPAFTFEKSVSSASIWRNQDKEWLFSEEGQLSVFDTGNERFGSTGLALKNEGKEKFGEVAFLVVRESLDKENAKKLLEVLSQFSLKKVYIASPYDDTLAAMKKVEPRFWYAASPRSWVKWSLFETFGIERAFTLEADFIFVDGEISKLMSPNIVQEIRRRRLPMITVQPNEKLVFN